SSELRLFELFKAPLRFEEKDLACSRQRKFAAVSMDQGGSQFFFKLLNILCQRRLRDMQLFRRPGHMECTSQNTKVAKVTILDHGPATCLSISVSAAIDVSRDASKVM